MTFTVVDDEEKEEEDEEGVEEGTSPRSRNAHTVDVDPRRGVEMVTIAVDARRGCAAPAGDGRNVDGAAVTAAVIIIVVGIVRRATTFFFFLPPLLLLLLLCVSRAEQSSNQRPRCDGKNGVAVRVPCVYIRVYDYTRRCRHYDRGGSVCVMWV